MDLGRQTVIYPMKGTSYYRIILLISKILKAVAYFAAYAILKKIQTVSFLLVLKICAVIILFPIQKPFSSGKSVSVSEWFQVARFSFVRLIIDALWIEGLYLCGPLRFILLFEHSEIIIMSAVSTVVYGATSPSKVRGTICFIIGLLLVAFFDHDVNHVSSEHPEGVHKSLLIHKIYELFSNFGLSDHKVGVIVLLVAVCLDAAFVALSRSLVSSVGGAKRLHALSSLVSLVPLVPLFLLGQIYRDGGSSAQQQAIADLELAATASSDSSAGPLWSLSFWSLYVGTIFVLDFYFTSLANARLGSLSGTHLAKLFVTVTALVLSCMWSSDGWIPSLSALGQTVGPTHQLSAGVLFAILAILYASSLLIGSKPSAGSDSAGANAQFIGYSVTGLPLFVAGQSPSHGMALLSSSEAMGLWYHVTATLKGIMAERSSRRIFAFLCLNLSFTFVELLYGVWTNSLGLISDGFHMLFDSAALIVGLYAAVVSHWKPTRVFSYGFHSAQVLSGFVNALFLLVISGSVLVNALSRIHRPPHIHTDRLMAVSVAGLLVNLVGIVALGHAHSHGAAHSSCGSSNAHGHSHGASGSAHGHSHGANDSAHGHSHTANGSGAHHMPHNVDQQLHYGHAHGQKKRQSHDHHGHSHAARDANLRGVYLHVLADTLGSVGVIFSSYLVSTYGWNVADPICSVFIASAIGYSAMPLLYETIGSLTLRAPDHAESPKSVVNMILELDGVVAVYNPFIWSQTRAATCISVCVQVESNVCEQVMLARIKELIAMRYPDVAHLTIQVEKEVVHQHFQAMGLSPTMLLYAPKATSLVNGYQPQTNNPNLGSSQIPQTVSLTPYLSD